MLEQDIHSLDTHKQGAFYLPQCNTHAISQDYDVAQLIE